MITMCPSISFRLRGGWWYKSCHKSNLNGYQHERTYSASWAEGINWEHWRGIWYSLKRTSMMIRPAIWTVLSMNFDLDRGRCTNKVSKGRCSVPLVSPMSASSALSITSPEMTNNFTVLLVNVSISFSSVLSGFLLLQFLWWVSVDNNKTVSCNLRFNQHLLELSQVDKPSYISMILGKERKKILS